MLGILVQSSAAISRRYLYSVFLWRTRARAVAPPLACRASKLRFDAEEDFKTRARAAVTKLQGGDEEVLAAWKLLCEISRRVRASATPSLPLLNPQHPHSPPPPSTHARARAALSLPPLSGEALRRHLKCICAQRRRSANAVCKSWKSQMQDGHGHGRGRVLGAA